MSTPWLEVARQEYQRPSAATRPVHRSYDAIGGLLDPLLAALLLLALFPLLAVVALVVRLSGPGPILYAGERVGRCGRRIRIYKFRTMRVGAEQEIGARLLTAADRVVTPVGRFLRYLKLDELPQLINVLKGEMKLVGPRPVRPVFVPALMREIPGYERRFEVAPGITGLAQLRGGYYTSPRNKLRYELLYIRRRCLTLDLKIIVGTIVILLRRACERPCRWVAVPSSPEDEPVLRRPRR